MGRTYVRGIRGAITVERNTPEDIIQATGELLQAIMAENNLDPEDIASAFFTVTDDLNAEFPATAARELLGWKYVPLLCAREIAVPGRLPMCIRVLVHVNTTRSQREIKHVYLREATRLRKDLLPQ
ncbi:chorismate mutase [Desulfofundulus thermocisternus]|uniref:chorismate mutase n=1 Tax=Desulfofundulus thermocisternus TaxID=42471 RepID=UPI001A0EDEAD|nr:chorismate mutase [Desulfofundulus thermocisternus]MBE3584598.1 chorismate mutase [Thermoanaerobacter sp.]MCS5696587.1 chorismate mutase [Desulfofundulus thermocisternus]